MAESSDRWRLRLPQALITGRGLFVEQHGRLDSSWWPDMIPWRPLPDGANAPSGWGLLVLDGLTPDLFSEARQTPGLLAAATQALAGNRPILASTAGSINQLKRSQVSEVASDPFGLDLDRLLAGDELLYLLSTRCETPEPAAEGAVNGALYLTPIERSLAAALDAAGISWKAQVPVGNYRADFVVDGRLIVEADGARWHDEETDQDRDRAMEGLGYPTVRLTGRAIFGDIDGCIRRIREALTHHPTRRVYASLTPAQARARDHVDGPALVVAPAGSGKTLVVIERIKRLVDLGADPGRICAVAFTNAAVDEMSERLDPDLEAVTTTTLHRLGNAVRRDAGIGGPIIGDGSDAGPGVPTRWSIIQGLLRPTEYRGTSAAGRLWVQAIADYRARLEVPALDQLPLAGKPEQHRARFLEVHDGYEQELKRRHLTDFDGLILNATRALAQDRILRLVWSAKFDYVIVDEYQDLSPAKLALLRIIASPARNLAAVGDDDQIIYGFAGASPRAFGDIERAWPDLRLLPLDRNFRSPHDLVVRAGWLISRNRDRVKKNITPQRSLERDPHVQVATDAAYDKMAVDFVKAELARGIEPGQIALLFRLSSFAGPVEIALDKAGIPYVPLAKESLLHDPTIRWARAWLRVVGGRGSAEDYQQTLRVPTRYLDKETIEHLAADDAESQIKAVISNPYLLLPRSMKQGPELLRDGLIDYLATLQLARAVGPTPAAMLSALKLESALQVAADMDDEKRAAQPRRNSDPSVMIRVMERFVSYATTLEELEAWFDNSTDPDIAAAQELRSDHGQPVADRVALSTIHQAKGKEWTSVAVLGPMNSMPDPRAETSAAQEEERRIAYVAVTRAQQQLLFCASSVYAAELNSDRSGMNWETYYAIETGQVAAEEQPLYPPPGSPVVATETRPASLLEAVRQRWRRIVS